MPFRFFVIPFLILSTPDFSLSAQPTDKWPINVVFRKASVCVDVVKLAGISGKSRWMMFLLDWVKRRDSLCFAKIFFARISSGIRILIHKVAV